MTAVAESFGPAIEAILEKVWNPGPRPGRKARNVLEYRDTPSSPWTRSAMHWDYLDVAFLNRFCGYEKYRVVGTVMK